MGLFVRLTLVVAVAILAFAALIMLVKLLFIAALVAAVALGVGFALRAARRGFGPKRGVRVTALTARR